MQTKSAYARHRLIAVLPAALLAAAPLAATAGDTALILTDAGGNERLAAGVLPLSPAGFAERTGGPPFDIDWQTTLRGSYVSTSEGTTLRASLAPQGSIAAAGRRWQASVTTSGEISLPLEGQEVGLRSAAIEGQGEYQIDSLTRASLSGRLGYAAPDRFDAGIERTIETPATVLNGAVSGSVRREGGPFSVTLSGSAERIHYGETRLVDGTTTSGEANSLVSTDGALRVGYQVTPIFEVFGSAGVGRDLYDAPDPANGLRADSTDYALAAGVNARWSEVLEAEVSAGLGTRRFDEAALGETQAHLLEARVIFTPDPTLRLAAAISSDFAPARPSDPGPAQLRTTASAEADYTVNSWMRLRASTAWYTARFLPVEVAETGRAFGVGADYLVNRHVTVSADYQFDRRDRAATGIEDTQRVTVGITLAR